MSLYQHREYVIVKTFKERDLKELNKCRMKLLLVLPTAVSFLIFKIFLKKRIKYGITIFNKIHTSRIIIN